MQISIENNDSKTNFKGTVVRNQLLDRAIHIARNKEEVYPVLDCMLNKTPKKDVFEFKYKQTSTQLGKVQLLYNGVVARECELMTEGGMEERKANAVLHILKNVSEYLDAPKHTEYNNITTKTQNALEALEDHELSLKKGLNDEQLNYWDAQECCGDDSTHCTLARSNINTILARLNITGSKKEVLKTKQEQKLEKYYEGIKKQLGYDIEQKQESQQNDTKINIEQCNAISEINEELQKTIDEKNKITSKYWYYLWTTGYEKEREEFEKIINDKDAKLRSLINEKNEWKANPEKKLNKKILNKKTDDSLKALEEINQKIKHLEEVSYELQMDLDSALEWYDFDGAKRIQNRINEVDSQLSSLKRQKKEMESKS